MKLAEVILSSMKTPSYPSGHSTQGYLVGLYLSEKFDDEKLVKNLYQKLKLYQKQETLVEHIIHQIQKLVKNLVKKCLDL